MWNLFKDKFNISTNTYESWSFGVDPDELLRLVLEGKKTATSSLHYFYVIENEDLPKVGEYSVILDSNNNAGCIIKTTNVTILPFNEVSESQAFKEGEGNQSLKYWQDVHEEFFKKCLDEINVSFDENMLVVYEEFEIVYK